MTASLAIVVGRKKIAARFLWYIGVMAIVTKHVGPYFRGGELPKIAIINKATVPMGVDFSKLIVAMQKTMDFDFAPVWGTPCKLVESKKPIKGYWSLVFTDTADQAQALGYHDISLGGLPLGKVFVKTTLKYKEKVSVTASHELCLTGDTLIPLLDGTRSTIKELVGRDHFWVYSIENGLIRPGRAHSARLTKKNAPIVRVTLDNGESIRCTPDHPFLMRDNSYRPASALVAGDSLMPLYRRIIARRAKKTSTPYDYEQVHVPADCAGVFTNHKVVSVETCGREDVYDLTVDNYHNFATEAGVFVHNCEMLVDPAVNLCMQAYDGTIYAYETADAVEGVSYLVDGIPMSNWVYPSYFEEFRSLNSTQFDHMKKIKKPLQLLPGGYASVFINGAWTQIFGSKKRAHMAEIEDRIQHRAKTRRNTT
jgi:hypothetical protein